MTGLFQVVRRQGSLWRVKPDEAPVVDLHLEDHETLLSFDFARSRPDASRKTVDWHWVAVVACDLRPDTDAAAPVGRNPGGAVWSA